MCPEWGTFCVRLALRTAGFEEPAGRISRDGTKSGRPGSSHGPGSWACVGFRAGKPGEVFQALAGRLEQSRQIACAVEHPLDAHHIFQGPITVQDEVATMHRHAESGRQVGPSRV